jgi:hypothetical protein
MFNRKKVVDAFVCRVDLGDTRAAGCLILPDGFPRDRATSATDEITGERAIFK